MHNNSPPKPDEAGHDPPPEGPGPAGLTEKLTAASAKRARRVLAAEVRK
jgi:hypothetical protein